MMELSETIYCEKRWGVVGSYSFQSALTSLRHKEETHRTKSKNACDQVERCCPTTPSSNLPLLPMPSRSSTDAGSSGSLAHRIHRLKLSRNLELHATTL